MSDIINTIDVVGDEAVFGSILDRSITEIADDMVETVGSNAFYGCGNLTTVNFPVVTSIGSSAFYNCKALATANFPTVTSVDTSALRGCAALTTVDLPMATSISTYAFSGCSNLSALILRKTDAVCTMASINAVNPTAIYNGVGYIYVPSALVDSYKSASNWSNLAARFRALEDYTVDGTTTGELDPTKI